MKFTTTMEDLSMLEILVDGLVTIGILALFILAIYGVVRLIDWLDEL